MREIDASGVPTHRTSYRYDLFYRGKRYPPKYVISIATKYALGRELLPDEFNAVEAKNYFLREGFAVLEREFGSEKVKSKLLNEDDESSFQEGAEKYTLHRSLERDPAIARKAKALRIQQQGELKCDVCDLVFADVYGAAGAGYIEAHHTVPVSELRGLKKTRISDLALVCANCHRVLHIAVPPMSTEELRRVVQSNRRAAVTTDLDPAKGRQRRP